MSVACNLDIPLRDCTKETCCLEQGATLNYLPTLPGNIVYAAVFGVLLIAQLYLGFRHRIWGFVVGMFCGLSLEVLGYAGRIWITESPFDLNPFLLYLVCLTIAPAFLSASIYLCLSRVVVVFGTELSRMAPRNYSIICIILDVTSLLLQAVGGAIAAVAVKGDGQDVQLGTHIMVAGLAFQVFSLLVFTAMCLDFALRVRRSSFDANPAFADLRSRRMFKGFLLALGVATFLVFIRSVYRVAELQGGFDSAIANNEPAFMVFEGPMIIVAVAVLTVFHPGTVFKGAWSNADWSLGSKKQEMAVTKFN